MTSTRRNPGWAALAVVAILMMLAAAVAASAQTLTTLHSFDKTDGEWPSASLVQATDGNLYGTTYLGGIHGVGDVFKITPSGTLTALYSFCPRGGECTDGADPLAGIVEDIHGNFYGTTPYGGANGFDDGAIFKMTPSGTLTTVYSFCSKSGCADGALPDSALVQAPDGNFYGTTDIGGANDFGTVFKITPTGMLTTLHRFAGYPTDGAYPHGQLVEATDGNFYGTTGDGGASGTCTYGCGTVFKITPGGMLTTLYSFCSQTNCADGEYPAAGLVQGGDGNFYGTTPAGGANGGGTVFKITPTGALTTLPNLGGDEAGTLVQGSDGNFYGATANGGGVCDCGTIFEITPSGYWTTLHSFDSTDGDTPGGALVQDTDGKFYGTTVRGGANGDGTVFSLDVGLGPFVETRPALGNVGMAVKILGTDLTGATSVTFNGTAAVFKVISSSLIGATVPVGASTGPVQVTLGNGTLSSNVPFRVRP